MRRLAYAALLALVVGVACDRHGDSIETRVVGSWVGSRVFCESRRADGNQRDTIVTPIGQGYRMTLGSDSTLVSEDPDTALSGQWGWWVHPDSLDQGGILKLDDEQPSRSPSMMGEFILNGGYRATMSGDTLTLVFDGYDRCDLEFVRDRH